MAFVDITERRELQQTVLNASEKVRRDIGRELHDVLSSDLAALAMNADNLRREPDAEEIGSDAALVMLEGIVQGIRTAAGQSRSLSHALIPAALQEEDLTTALETLCHEYEEHIWVRLDEEEGRLVLTVRDDGDGLPEKTHSGEGVGLQTMTYRAHLIGATLTIDSAEEGGPLVRCTVPLWDAPAN